MKRLDVSTRGKTDVNEGVTRRPLRAVITHLLAPAGVLVSLGCGGGDSFPSPVDARVPAATDGGVPAQDAGPTPTPDAGPVDAGPVQVASCEFSTKTAFLLHVVTPSSDERKLVKEGDSVTIGANDYIVTKTEDGGLLLVDEAGSVSGVSGSGRVTVDVANRLVRLEQAGQDPRSFSSLGVVGVNSLTEDARYDDNENYVSRAAVTVTAGNRTRTFVVKEGEDASVTSENGDTTATATFQEGNDSEAAVEVSGSGPGLSVSPTLGVVAEGGVVSFGSGAVSATVNSVTDGYDLASTPADQRCREYSVKLLFNDSSEAREVTLVESEAFDINGRTVRVKTIQYDDDAAKRYVEVEVTVGASTTTSVLANGQMTTLEGSGATTQVMLVDMSFSELRPPVAPEGDAGAGSADGG